MKALSLVIGIVVMAFLWLLVGIGLNSILANMIPFRNMTPEEFSAIFRFTSLAVAISTLLLYTIWFIYGSRDNVTINLRGAKSTWLLLFVLSIVLSIAQTIYMTIATQNEGVPLIDLLLIFCGTSLVGWSGYWFVSYFWSPNNVKYCVLAKK